MSFIDNLISLCYEAKSSQPIQKFTINSLNDLKNIKSAIYIIEQKSGDPDTTFDDLKHFKKTSDRKCPAINAPSKTMYVGSSTTGVEKRIKQHLGDGPKGTYALHLNHWFKEDFEITILEYDKPREVIQIIEDDLSDQLKPAFGKRGSNNK